MVAYWAGGSENGSDARHDCLEKSPRAALHPKRLNLLWSRVSLFSNVRQSGKRVNNERGSRVFESERTAVRTTGEDVEQSLFEGRGVPLSYLFVLGIMQGHLHKLCRTLQTWANSFSLLSCSSFLIWMDSVSARFTRPLKDLLSQYYRAINRVLTFSGSA